MPADVPPPLAQPPRATRLAPSPTGALHLGNARTFLVTWALARNQGWRIVLRVEDLDGPRVKAGAAEAAVRTLAWLGMDWDEGPVYQSADLVPYVAAMQTLAGQGLAYPSDLSRGDLESALSAPQEGSGEVPFPAGLRPPGATDPKPFEQGPRTWRFVTPEAPVPFVDAFAGPRVTRPCEEVGDFIVWTKADQPAYQLAVVVDDARQGVTDVVRGDDLIPSTGRQMLLRRALGLGADPSYTHLPLVLGPDGRRLAKRHGDTRVESYRSAGVPAGRLIALMARWCGVEGVPGVMSAEEFRGALRLDRIPPGSIRFSPEDDAWLRQR